MYMLQCQSLHSSMCSRKFCWGSLKINSRIVKKQVEEHRSGTPTSMCCKVLYSQIKVTAHEGAAAQQQQQQHFATSHPQIIIQAGCCESCTSPFGCCRLWALLLWLNFIGTIPFETSGERLTELSRHTHFQDEAVQFKDRDSNSLILKWLPMDWIWQHLSVGTLGGDEPGGEDTIQGVVLQGEDGCVDVGVNPTFSVVTSFPLQGLPWRLSGCYEDLGLLTFELFLPLEGLDFLLWQGQFRHRVVFEQDAGRPWAVVQTLWQWQSLQGI